MSYYHQLDSIQIGIYEQLTSLVQSQDVKDQSKIVLSITHLLTTFHDYLAIIKTRDEDGLYDIYANKLKGLREKVREVQIRRSDAEGELIHSQRLEKYGEVATSTDDDVSDSRDKLFGNRVSPGTGKPKPSVDHQILSHNKQITSSLQATRQLLSATMLQSELNIDSLDQQTKELHKLNDDFLKFNDLLNKSKQIVKFIEKQDKLDKRRIYLSIGFFALCCAWVIWKRILRLPVRMFLWSFFKVFGIVGWIFGDKSGFVLSMGNVESLSSVISSMSSPGSSFSTSGSSLSTLSSLSSVSDMSSSISDISSTISDISSTFSDASSTGTISSLSSSIIPTKSFDLENDYVIDLEESVVVQSTTERLVDEL